MLTPSEYRKRILLVASGMTPQVVTETIYALAVSRNPFVPTEVHLICTSEGAKRARCRLLSEKRGWFHKLCEDYELRGIEFSEQNIHVLEKCNGTAMGDIRDEEDNRSAADSITERIRTFTADPDCALHVSLAGGRKTMSFFAGYALSLFGRPQDRLSHVLVQPEYEFSPEFFYPTPQPYTIEGNDQRSLDASKAEVMLAEIPFVRMRDGLPKELLSGRKPYSVVVEAANRAIGPAELVIDQAGGKVQAAGRIFSMRPSAIAMLSVFARNALNGKGPLGAPPKEVGDLKWSRRYLRELRNGVQDEEDLDERTRFALRDGMDGAYFDFQLKRLQNALAEQLGSAVTPYLIDNGGKRPRKYQCTLPVQSIQFRTIIGEVTVDD